MASYLSTGFTPCGLIELQNKAHTTVATIPAKTGMGEADNLGQFISALAATGVTDVVSATTTDPTSNMREIKIAMTFTLSSSELNYYHTCVPCTTGYSVSL
jgi:hypothetical protein